MAKVVRPLTRRPERLLDRLLRLRVHGGGRLVQDQDARVVQDGAGDGDALLLAPREASALLAHLRVVAVRLADDELVGVRRRAAAAMTSARVASGRP